jgi:glutamine synthetase
MRRTTWQPGTALLLADATWLDHEPVGESPRQVLKRQIERLAERGWTAYVGTELEFILFEDSFEQAWDKRYQGLRPANQYNVDYSVLGTGRVEPILRAIRLGMRDAGLQVESAKGECNLGQHEIAFKYTDALTTCDNHTVYKTGAKEIAAQHGSSLTFMAKFNEQEGNSCHVHLSLRDGDDNPVFAGNRAGGVSEIFEQFLAGQLAGLRELSYFFAPNINSYKRYQTGSFAPTAVAWGFDNRTCALRVVGHGPSLRFENRLPGGDVNPYLAVAAMIAAGLYGVDHGLELEDAETGNAYVGNAPRVPTTLREAADLFEKSQLARDAFGANVVEHYTNTARVEIAAYDAAVTDWELFRGFERM